MVLLRTGCIFFKEDHSYHLCLCLPLHTLLPVSPRQGVGLGGTAGAWLQGENEQRK